MKQKKTWFKLDTAGNLYPAIERPSYPGMFRLSVTMKQETDRDLVEKAAKTTIKRFPGLRVKLKSGLFWFYFEDNSSDPIIWQDTAPPCQKIHRKKNNDYLFRIITGRRTIAVEFFHALSDGFGGSVFLKTLIAEYLKLTGTEVAAEEGVLNTRETADPEELENAFLRYYEGKRKRVLKEPSVYHPTGSNLSSNKFLVITGELPIKPLLEITRNLGVTITEYITGVLAFSLYRLQQRERRFFHPKPVRISVPVNLRNIFPSKTLRNFSQFIKPGIDPDLGDYSFEEVLHQVYHAIQYEKNKKFLSALNSSHVSLELNPVIRAVPLFMKNLIMNIVFNYFGENRFSGTFSNLGLLKIPESMKPHVDHFDFLIGPNPINPVNCSAIGFNEKMRISFSRSIKESNLENLFFSHFINEGIPVTIESNN